ncbi:MAG: hypothetical protein RLY31_741 [Bacteroidota bacterium]|jgi:FkbM family methyltransferase
MYRLLPANPIVVEAGAYNGDDTYRMARLWPQGRIYALEPIPALYHRLIARTAELPNVRTFPLALGDRTGNQIMYRSAGSSDASSSLLPPRAHLEFHPAVSFEHQLVIQASTLDDFFHSLPEQRLDLLWLDIQGMELAVLKKGEAALRCADHLFLEVHFVESYEGCATFPILRQWLSERGYRLAWLDDRYADAGNALFVRRGHRQKQTT